MVSMVSFTAEWLRRQFNRWEIGGLRKRCSAARPAVNKPLGHKMRERATARSLPFEDAHKATGSAAELLTEIRDILARMEAKE